MKSCIYEGRVSHRRFSPKRHSFDQKLYMLYLDLSELDHVFSGRWAWSAKRPALAWLRRSDHLGPAREDLDVSVRNFVESKSGSRPDGPIRLLTHLRYFGFIMNPVSFYFCFSADQRLQHVVAEVNNTPWGEQHCYLLEPAHFAPPAGQSRKLSEKDFHVSPFLPMEMFYRWNISLQNDSLKIGIQNSTAQQRMLSVSMQMNRREMTARNLNSVLCRYPFMSARVFLNIYWQALLLWWKKTPFFPHPNRASKLKINLGSLHESSKESA